MFAIRQQSVLSVHYIWVACPLPCSVAKKLKNLNSCVKIHVVWRLLTFHASVPSWAWRSSCSSRANLRALRSTMLCNFLYSSYSQLKSCLYLRNCSGEVISVYLLEFWAKLKSEVEVKWERNGQFKTHSNKTLCVFLNGTPIETACKVWNYRYSLQVNLNILFTVNCWTNIR